MENNEQETTSTWMRVLTLALLVIAVLAVAVLAKREGERRMTASGTEVFNGHGGNVWNGELVQWANVREMST